MIFYSLFKTLVGCQVTVECKNNLSVRGTLSSVDQFLNIKLEEVTVLGDTGCPDLHSLKNMFLRGGSVRYIYMAPEDVDLVLLHDASRSDLGARHGLL